jgi:hypothetical protein
MQPILEPVRESFRSGKSLVWTRVNDLPDFVYFNHSIHINKGVGCNTCHGPVDRMPLMYNNASLRMEWCLDCHPRRINICGRAIRCSICGTSSHQAKCLVTLDGKEYHRSASLGKIWSRNTICER